MERDPVALIVEPLDDGDYDVSIHHIVRKLDDDPFRMEMFVDVNGNLRIMI